MLAPDHRAAFGFRERQADPHDVPDPPDLARQHVADAERVADLRRIAARLPHGEACAAGADEDAPKARQLEDQLVRETFGEEALVLVPADDAEGQHRDREGALLARGATPGRRGLQPVRRELAPEPVQADRLGQVLEPLLAEIVEGVGRASPDVVEEHVADADRVGLGALLDARRDVHPVADEIVAADHHVGEMEPEAQPQAIGLRDADAGERVTDLGRAAQRVDGAAELHQRGIAGDVEDPALQRRDLLP